MGSLNLLSGAILNYEFATPGIVGGGVNDLIEVNGDVTLDGTLNVSALAGFGIGKYRMMNYTGSLFNNALDFGVMPAGFAYQLQTAVAGRRDPARRQLDGRSGSVPGTAPTRLVTMR